MPLYESTFIARQDMSPADVEQLADSMASIIQEQGGKLVKREYWGLRSLSYRIKKNRKGHYTFFGIEAPADAVKEMERRLGLSEDVIRLLTVRVDKIANDPTVMMAPAASAPAGERGPRGPYAGRPSRPRGGEAASEE